MECADSPHSPHPTCDELKQHSVVGSGEGWQEEVQDSLSHGSGFADTSMLDSMQLSWVHTVWWMIS